MNRQKSAHTFTLRRLPFWVCIAAGVSGIALALLLQDELATGIVVAMSLGVILACLAARFRDIGLSGWLAPVGLIPAVALFVGFTAGDGVEGRKAPDGDHLVYTVVFSLMSSGSWIAYLVH